jgi:hypothetical protein
VRRYWPKYYKSDYPLTWEEAIFRWIYWQRLAFWAAILGFVQVRRSKRHKVWMDYELDRIATVARRRYLDRRP